MIVVGTKVKLAGQFYYNTKKPITGTIRRIDFSHVEKTTCRPYGAVCCPYGVELDDRSGLFWYQFKEIKEI